MRKRGSNSLPIGFLILLFIGIVVNSSESFPSQLSNLGGILVLIGGLGFAFSILTKWKLFR